MENTINPRSEMVNRFQHMIIARFAYRGVPSTLELSEPIGLADIEGAVADKIAEEREWGYDVDYSRPYSYARPALAYMFKLSRSPDVGWHEQLVLLVYPCTEHGETDPAIEKVIASVQRKVNHEEEII